MVVAGEFSMRSPRAVQQQTDNHHQGDPSGIKDAPFIFSNNCPRTDGRFKNRNLTECEPYTHRMRSYCDDGDAFCTGEGAIGLGTGGGVHGSYMRRYKQNAVDFVVHLYNGNRVKQGKCQKK